MKNNCELPITKIIRKYTKKYITDNHEPLSKHNLSKLILIKEKNNPLFKNKTKEYIRTTIRQVTGNNGDTKRQYMKDKSLYDKLLNELPITHKEPYDFYYLDEKYDNILSLSDLHIPYQDDEAIALALEYGLQHKINCIILLGDIMDCYQLSKYIKNPLKPSLAREIKLTLEFFKMLRKRFPKQKIVFLPSNHELRLPYYLQQKAPELVELDCLKIENILQLSNFNIEIVKAFRPIKVGHLIMIHGHEVRMSNMNVNPARSLFLKLKDNAICGHSHRISEHMESRLIDQYTSCWSQGCLCELHPDYSPINFWALGFAHIKRYENNNFSVYNKKIINGTVL